MNLQFISFGEALTDLICEEGNIWRAHAGGSCWNVACAAARLGLVTAFAGAISTDCFGDELWRQSEAAGLDLRFLQRVAASPLLAIVHQARPPRYFFVGDNSADLHFDVKQLPDGWLQNLPWAHFGGISFARMSHSLLAIAEDLHQRGVQLSYDPNYRNLMGEDYLPVFWRMSKMVCLMKISEEDLHGFFPGQSVETSLGLLRQVRGQRPLLFTRGEEGATLFVGHEAWHCRSPQITLADTVGAGDASLAGYVASALRHGAQNWPQHLAWAVATGAASCTQEGANLPQLYEIEALRDDLTIHKTE